MSEWGLTGQERAVAALQRALTEGRVAHAYLFAGPPQVGKETAARRLAQALNCTGPAEGPCLSCRACVQIDERRHPDVEFLGVGGICDEGDHRDHRIDGSKDIRICQVRRLEKILSRSPFEARRRVAIIDPADAMNTDAANAFLKTLEEPPDEAVLILVSAHEEALPATVRSRCRLAAFAPLAVGVVEQALRERWSQEPERARLLARLSGGRLGWAVAAVEDESLVSSREARLDELLELSGASLSERFQAAGRFALEFLRERESVLSLLDLATEWWRDVLLTQAGLAERVTNVQRLDILSAYAGQYKEEAVARFLRDLGRARQDLIENVNPTLALEVLMLDLPATPSRGKETTAPASSPR